MSGRPRIVVALEGGLINSICAEGIDLSGVDVFVIDYDTEGADEADMQEVAGVEAFVRSESVGPIDAEVSASLTLIEAGWES